MFRKFKESPYAKAAALILITGALLIIFNSWISNHQISIGFETINRTLAPVYIGIIFTFILCPVYNACVKFLYHKMLAGSQKKGFSIGATLIHEEKGSLEINKDQKRTLLTASRVAATVVCVLLVGGLITLLFYFVVPQLVQTLIGLVNTLPQRLSTLSTWISSHFSKFTVITKWAENLSDLDTADIVEQARTYLTNDTAMSIAGTISTGVATAVKYVMNLFIGLLIMIYLLNYKERLFAITRKFINSTCSQKRKARLYEFASIVNETFIGFIVGRIIDSFIIGVLTFIVLKICSIPFALMISVVVGITNVIPFFGPFIGAIPSALILLTENPMDTLYFIIIILVVQQIDGNIIGPKIVGNAIGISSFWVLVSVLIGGGLFGFAGMALGVPVFAVIYRYVDKFMVASLKRKEKNTHTSYYFTMEQFGIEDDEVDLEPQKKQQSLFSRLRGERKDISQHRFAFDHNDHESNMDRRQNSVSGRAEAEKKMLEEDSGQETRD